MSRPHPHLAIPPGAAPPADPSPARDTDWNFLITPPDRDSLHLWHDEYRNASYSPISPNTPRAHHGYPALERNATPGSRPSSFTETGSPRLGFPEPHVYRSNSHSASLRPSVSYQHLTHRSTKSEAYLHTNHGASPMSDREDNSRPPSSYGSPETSPELPLTELSDELSNLTLQSDEGLRKYQAGQLSEVDEEWYRLVPREARQVLDKSEVLRQSILFEIVKSERDYVRDMELVKDVFIDPIRNTMPIPRERVDGFISEVFYNLGEVLQYHRKMLDKLFSRQQEQHPLVQSISDIILDTSLKFQPPYETYIKHYPLAEAYHRKELKRSPRYKQFLDQCSHDPRVRRRDLITFISRPVTRLPRLLVQLENVLKCTAPDHPDQETIPLILSVLHGFVKSTQPGIEAANSKVEFWNLCESLIYQKGEIIDLDLYDESRTLIHSGPLARRYRGDVGYTWADLHVALLDNYLLLLKPHGRSAGDVRHSVVSRPIPLEYLRILSFDSPLEYRKEKGRSSSLEHTPSITSPSSRGLFDFSRSHTRPVFPFTIYHASAKVIRRYTLYAGSEEDRMKWRQALSEGLGVRKVHQDSNMWFAPHAVNEGFFKIPPSTAASNTAVRYTGKVLCAAQLVSSGKTLVAVGCAAGIFVIVRGRTDIRRVLKINNPVSLHVLPEHNKVLIHHDEGISAYSMDLMARVALGTGRPQDLDASMERVSANDSAVIFTRVVKTHGRTLVLYSTKSLLGVRIHAVEAVSPTELKNNLRRSVTGNIAFRPFGDPSAWIRGDPHDIHTLHKSIGIATERGIVIADPTNLAASTSSSISSVPNFSNADNEPMLALKARLAGARPLGLIHAESNEWLIVFDEMGCYIDRHGIPRRSSGYLRWESKASSFAYHNDHLLLFSPEFIEIRSIRSGKLVQVVEGQDIRQVYASDTAILAVMAGRGDKTMDVRVEKLVELVETEDIAAQKQQSAQPSNQQALWDEWDM